MSRRIIAVEKGARPGPLAPRNACDLVLVEHAGRLTLALGMKIQFIFKDGTEDWKDPEKSAFPKAWEASIRQAWDGLLITRLDGRDVRLKLYFKIITGLSWTEQWEITVTRIRSQEFRTSYVHIGDRESALDSNDLRVTPKKGGGAQIPAVHEFGHMLGLKDEYKPGSPHVHDSGSLMHGGSTIKGRHTSWLAAWVHQVARGRRVSGVLDRVTMPAIA